ncbi:hypothetical protein [Mesorhizobium sp. NZP2298]|uniref:hypothetical protein n=1 Tax=Mesorhizobium sp. NZP2298 TaxID=2483403 RepID=UPI001FF06775|nr:hypothetical protein [Mesorhizobium sp. NZP2298]
MARRAEAIDVSEAKWLAEHIGANRPLYENERVGGGRRPLRDNERTLLALIKRASPEIHPALKPLLEKVA